MSFILFCVNICFMDIKKNDDIKLNIEAVTSEGSAVGHYNGIAVFVRGAVPGDIIIAHIIKRGHPLSSLYLHESVHINILKPNSYYRLTL